jgi:hypothetical protein
MRWRNLLQPIFFLFSRFRSSFSFLRLSVCLCLFACLFVYLSAYLILLSLFIFFINFIIFNNFFCIFVLFFLNASFCLLILLTFSSYLPLCCQSYSVCKCHLLLVCLYCYNVCILSASVFCRFVCVSFYFRACFFSVSFLLRKLNFYMIVCFFCFCIYVIFLFLLSLFSAFCITFSFTFMCVYVYLSICSSNVCLSVC